MTIYEFTSSPMEQIELGLDLHSLRKSADFFSVAMVAVDLLGRVIVWNRDMEILTGIGRAEMIGEAEHAYAMPFYGERRPCLLDLVLNPSDPRVRKLYGSLSWRGTSVSAEVFIPSLAGGLHLHCNAFPLLDGFGRVIGVAETVRDISEQKEHVAHLAQERDYMAATLSSIDEAVIAVDKQGRITLLNRRAEELTGWQETEALGESFQRLLVCEQCMAGLVIEPCVAEALSPGATTHLSVPELLCDRHGQQRRVKVSTVPIRAVDNTILGAIIALRDVTSEQAKEEALRVSEEHLEYLTANMLDVICEVDTEGYYRYVSPSCLSLLGYSPQELVGRCYQDFMHPADRQDVLALWDQSAHTLRPGKHEYRYLCKDGRYIWLESNGNPILDPSGKLQGAVVTSRDISDRKAMEERLRFLSSHDALTGTYNRAYFTSVAEDIDNNSSYPVVLILCDVDGLKLVNDSLGHTAGDQLLVEAASLLRSATSDPHLLARVDGDEFAILLIGESALCHEDICRRIRFGIDRYNETQPPMPLSMSLGVATSLTRYRPTEEMFREADNSMYHDKLLHQQSARNSIVQVLKQALEAKDFITDGHAERVKKLVIDVARFIGLPEESMRDLILLAQFHDIGKVGVPDSILFKAGPLTSDEWVQMRQHCEIGHRIASSAPELAPIADWILKHHEWWNGEGYPLGLKGSDIPLACRILSIVDAYDAMTSDRPYRNALPQATAVAEIKRQAGRQFDPMLVRVFVKVLGL